MLDIALPELITGAEGHSHSLLCLCTRLAMLGCQRHNFDGNALPHYLTPDMIIRSGLPSNVITAIPVPTRLAVTATTTLVSSGFPEPPGWHAMLLPDIQDAETQPSDDNRTLAVTLDAAKLSPLAVTDCDDEKPRFALSAQLTTGAAQP